MKITMAHGSGGKSSAQLMSDIFGKHFKNDILDRMEDAAVLEVSGRIACSTDSFVVTPLVFKGGDIGKLCVCGTVNDLLMMGAVPKYITCGFILEEGLDTDTILYITELIADSQNAAISYSDMQEMGLVFELAPEAADVNGTECYLLSTTITADTLQTMLQIKNRRTKATSRKRGRARSRALNLTAR